MRTIPISDDRAQAIRFAIHGRVQGVGFRWWTRRTASQFGLVGQVRNESDGSVIVLAAGPASSLAALRSALQHGPPGSVVLRVDEEMISPDLLPLDSFVIEAN